MNTSLSTAVSRSCAPYARTVFERCAEYALQLHADEVGPEHLLVTLMEDETCAAHRVAVHAFADPETIADEARALAAGITISGSAKALPFSARAVVALRSARRLAAERRDASVEVAHVLLAAFGELEDDLRTIFDDAGWNPGALETLLSTNGERAVDQTGHLFRHFADDAKRHLSVAAKLARATGAPSISPAHLFQAALQHDPRVERASGLTTARARIVLRGRATDESRVTGGPLGPDDALVTYLAVLPAACDTLGLLAAFHVAAPRELTQVLVRHKITPALIQRARGAFADPE